MRSSYCSKGRKEGERCALEPRNEEKGEAVRHSLAQVGETYLAIEEITPGIAGSIPTEGTKVPEASHGGREYEVSKRQSRQGIS